LGRCNQFAATRRSAICSSISTTARGETLLPERTRAGDGNSMENTVDRDPGTKWCVNTAASRRLADAVAQGANGGLYASRVATTCRTRPRSWLLEGSTTARPGSRWIARAGRPFENVTRPSGSRLPIPGRSALSLTFAPRRPGPSKSRRSCSPAPSGPHRGGGDDYRAISISCRAWDTRSTGGTA